MGQEATIPIEKAKEYILAGNATIIFVNNKTNMTLKYKVRQDKDNERLWWVNTLINDPFTGGPYLIGTIRKEYNAVNEDHLQWAFTPGRTYQPDIQIFKDAFKALWQRALNRRWKLGTNEKDIYEIMHDGTCLKCGRPLNDPESVRLCFGPDCRKQLGIS